MKGAPAHTYQTCCLGRTDKSSHIMPVVDHGILMEAVKKFAARKKFQFDLLTAVTLLEPGAERMVACILIPASIDLIVSGCSSSGRCVN